MDEEKMRLMDLHHRLVQRAIDAAWDAGFVVTASTVPYQPYAMRSYYVRVEIRERR